MLCIYYSTMSEAYIVYKSILFLLNVALLYMLLRLQLEPLTVVVAVLQTRNKPVYMYALFIVAMRFSIET